MTIRALLQESFQLSKAKGIEAREEAVKLARRSLLFNVGPRYPADIIYGDFRDVVTSDTTLRDYDLVTGTPPYFRVDFSVQGGDTVTSAIVREGGMPTARQSAPARCEFRGGIEAYALAASQVVAPDTGRFVVCENYLNHQRVLEAANLAKLQVLHVAKVRGREGKEPLFGIYTMRKPTNCKRETVAQSPAFQEEAFAVRDKDGNWTPRYLTVFQTLSIPPLGSQ